MDEGTPQPIDLDHPRNPIRETAVFSFFLGLSVLFLWNGLWPYPGAGTFGGGCLEYVWSGWWLKEGLLTRPLDPLFAPLIYWPVGASVAFHDFSYLNTLPSVFLPTDFLLGWHNLCLVATFALSGYFMYRFAFEVTGSRAGAVFAGLIFAFAPFRTSRLTQLNTLSQEFIPLLFLVAWRVDVGRSQANWKAAMLGGLFLALSALGGWYHLSILTVVLVAWGVWKWRLWFWGFLCRLFFVSGAILSPWLIQILWHQIRFDYYPHTLIRSHRFSCDLLYYFVPYEYDSWSYSKIVPKIESTIGPGWITSPERVGYFLGYAAIALAAITIFRRRKKVWSLWVFLGLVALILSLGPYLKVGGRDTINLGKLLDLLGFPESWTEDWTPKFPLPFLLFKEIPLIGGAAVPRRFAEIVVLVVALLAAEGFKTLSLRLGSKQDRRKHFLFVIGLIGLFLTIEQWKFIYPATPEPISPFYTEFLEPDSTGAILELPIDYNNESRHYGYYQTRHGRSILSAIIGRVPKQAHEYVKNNPLIIQLQSDLPGTSQLDNADFQDGFDSLEEIGVEYIVLHLDRMSLEDTEKLEMWFQRFGAEEVYRDNALVALRIGRGV